MKVINFLFALVKLFFLLLIGLVVFTTCSNDATPVTVSPNRNSSANTAESTVSLPGKRSNPVLNGQTASFDLTYYGDSSERVSGNASITLSKFLRGEEAYAYLVQQNQFNDPAPEGMEWLIFDINLTLNEGSVDYAFNSSSVYFKAIGSDGSQVEQADWGTLDDSFGGNDLYVGGSDWGQKALLVPVGDTGVLIEANGFSTPSIFFNLN